MAEHLNSDDMNDLKRIVGGYSDDDMRKLYLKSETAFKDILESLAKNIARSTDKTLSNTDKQLGGFLSALKTKAADAGKTVEDLNKKIEATGTVAEKTAKKIGKHIEEVHGKYHNFLRDVAEKKNPLIEEYKVTIPTLFNQLNQAGKLPDFGAKNFNAVTSVFSDLGISLKSLIPELALFTSVTASVIRVFSQLNEIANEQSGWRVLAGSNSELFSGFTQALDLDGLNSMTSQARRTAVELNAIGHSFYQAGGYLENFNPAIKSNIEFMGQWQNVTGQTDEVSGEWLVTLQNMGKVGDDANNVLKGFAAQALKSHLSIQDLNQSTSEGIALWHEFGGAFGMTADKFTTGLETSISLMKSFGISSKDAQKAVTDLMGQDVSTHLRSLGYQAAALNMNPETLESQMMLNPGKGVQNQYLASLLEMRRNTGGQAFMSAEDRIATGHPTEINMHVKQQEAMEKMLNGVRPELLDNIINVMGSKGINTDQQIRDAFKEMTGPGGSFEDMVKAVEATPESLLKQISIDVGNIYNKFAVPFLPVIGGLAKFLHVTPEDIAKAEREKDAYAKAAKEAENSKGSGVFSVDPRTATSFNILANQLGQTVQPSVDANMSAVDQATKNYWAKHPKGSSSLLPSVTGALGSTTIGAPPSISGLLPSGGPFEHKWNDQGIDEVTGAKLEGGVLPGPPPDNQQIAALKKNIVNTAKKTAQTMGNLHSLHLCATAAHKVAKKELGINLTGDAWQFSNQLASNPMFKEVTGQTPQAGDFEVWGKSKKHPYGHVEIPGENGMEYSDFMTKRGWEENKGYGGERLFRLVETTNAHLEKIASSTQGTHKELAGVANAAKLQGVKISSNASTQSQMVRTGTS